MTGLTYCAAQVRAQDIDRFHLALAAPTGVQEAWLALAAFNLELARTSDRVTDPNLGLLRLQWWRDALGEIGAGGPVRGHQVALGLSNVGERLDLISLETLISAREADLDTEPFADQEALTAYLIQTSGALMRAQAVVLGVKDAEAIANHLGCAFGCIGMARTLAAQAGQHPKTFREWHEAPMEGIQALSGFAQMHLDRAQELRTESKEEARLAPLFKVRSYVGGWLLRLQSMRKPVGHPSYARPLPFQALRFAMARS